MNESDVWDKHRYQLLKLIGDKFKLYDLTIDLVEKNDVDAQNPDVVSRMKDKLQTWQQAVWRSNEGQDYPEKKVLVPDNDLRK